MPVPVPDFAFGGSVACGEDPGLEGMEARQERPCGEGQAGWSRSRRREVSAAWGELFAMLEI